jgi:uncharacterized membrane protein YphA (DoxX/SURF4 family)
MKKTTKIIYWIATLWLALGMVSTGIIQLIKQTEEVENITRLGYPVYMLPLLGVLKIVGVIVVLVPRFTLLKEWAYAGFFFAMAGAAYSRVAAGDGISEIAPPLLLLVLTVVSWYFRPVNRKAIPLTSFSQ